MTVWKMTQMQARLFWREPVALFFSLAFPVLLLFMFGILFGNEPNEAWDGFGYIDSEVPGLTGVIIATLGLTGIPVAVATARERKILRRFRATPMPVWTLFASDIVVHVAVAAVGVVALTVAGVLIFDVKFGGNGAEVAAGFLLASLSFASVGYVLAGLAPTVRSAQIVGQILFFPNMFLSGATFPRPFMPEGVQRVSEFLPLTHVVRLLQDLWFGRGWNTTSTLILVGMLVVGALVSVRLFRWE